MSIDKELLKEAVEWAEAEAKKPRELSEWEQSSYLIHPDERDIYDPDDYFFGTPDQYTKTTDCGTSYCIAGYVGQRLEPRYRYDTWVQFDEGDNGIRGVHVSDFAAEKLGLDEDQAHNLFSGGNSIQDVRRIAEEIAGGPL